jgi:ABC-type Mn2+/Zn2+ transport system permease subunit
MHWLTDPLQFSFMVNALLVGSLVAVVCAVLSCFLVLKGWSLMGDAISHAVLPGIVLAFMAGLPVSLLSIGAFGSGLFCAVATGWIKQQPVRKRDAGRGFHRQFIRPVLMTKVETELHRHILLESARHRKELIGQTTRIGLVTLR